jgi:hypothetical protein
MSKILDNGAMREMTEAELAQRSKDAAEAEALAREEAARSAARTSALTKLAALGLTEAEIAALLGV